MKPFNVILNNIIKKIKQPNLIVICVLVRTMSSHRSYNKISVGFFGLFLDIYILVDSVSLKTSSSYKSKSEKNLFQRPDVGVI